jgi:hypothetical protein
MNTNRVNVGRVAMNIFVVAPERFKHMNDGYTTLQPYTCFVDQYEAVKEARVLATEFGISYCVYKLVDTFTAGPHE